MVDQFTKGQLFSGNWPKGEPNLPLNQKNRPGNVYRKFFKFPENPGNLNWWNCNIILMTINEAHLVALRATITLTYIPVMTPGLYDTVSWASWDISWAYWMVSWTNFDENIDILTQETIHYAQEMSQEAPGNVSGGPRKRVIESRSHHWDIS